MGQLEKNIKTSVSIYYVTMYNSQINKMHIQIIRFRKRLKMINPQQAKTISKMKMKNKTKTTTTTTTKSINRFYHC